MRVGIHLETATKSAEGCWYLGLVAMAERGDEADKVGYLELPVGLEVTRCFGLRVPTILSTMSLVRLHLKQLLSPELASIASRASRAACRVTLNGPAKRRSATVSAISWKV